MSVRIIHDTEQERACLYCTTSDQPFGPVVYGSDCESFIEWWSESTDDARRFTVNEIHDLFRAWKERQR